MTTPTNQPKSTNNLDVSKRHAQKLDTTPTISEKIERALEDIQYAAWVAGNSQASLHYSDETFEQSKQDILRVMADFAEHITPEKKVTEAQKVSNNVFHLRTGWNDCIDTITKRTKELLK